MKIELARSEINAYDPETPWEELGIVERRNLASAILRNRPDAKSQEFAFLIETNNPNFQDFVVVENA